MESGGTLDAAALAEEPPGVRRRVLRSWLLDHGVAEISDAHLRAVDALVAAVLRAGAFPAVLRAALVFVAGLRAGAGFEPFFEAATEARRASIRSTTGVSGSAGAGSVISRPSTLASSSSRS